MYIAGQYTVCIVQNSLCLIGKNNLYLGASLFNDIGIIFYIIYIGKFMLVLTKKLTIFFQSKNVALRIDTRLIQLVIGKKCITHLVTGIAEHQHHLFRPHGDPF